MPIRDKVLVAPAIELRGITKRFAAVEVLSEVDLALTAGKVHALAGENGAGKSTLVKILGGIHQPDAGRILKDGNEITIDSVADARRQGIAVVHQHPALFPDLSVAENVFVGRQPRRGGRVDWAAMTSRAASLLAGLRMEIDVRLPVKMLSIAERQAIEIAKALSIEARILVLDEPTSAISAREVDRLFEIVRRLQVQGVAILFISIALCAAGIYAASILPSSVFPQTNFPRVVILVDNGVMPADEMMATITRPIEAGGGGFHLLHQVSGCNANAPGRERPETAIAAAARRAPAGR